VADSKIVLRGAAPLIMALGMVGAGSAAAWASPAVSPAAPPWRPVTISECIHAHGRVIIDRRDHRFVGRCVGGFLGGHPVLH
jgi:hypothetical protein